MRFDPDKLVLAAIVVLALAVAARTWLHDHPQHDPWAPLAIGDPVGWATKPKLARALRDRSVCRDVLGRGGVAFTALPPTGAGECRRDDRQSWDDALLSPARPEATCGVDLGLALWLRHSVDPAASAIMNGNLARIEHFGTVSCRRLYGADTGQWSEHATGNAIDIAAFVLTDGRRISVRGDWNGGGAKGAFLRAVRDGACNWFGTTLSPDYNAAHADHLHLDQASRFGAVCR
jgi:hypothetical protein